MDLFSSRTMPSISSTEKVAGPSAGFGIREVKELSSIMAESTGVPYDHMPISFLKRRLSYIFKKHNIRNADMFRQMLETENYKARLFYDFPVDTTEMFRDPGFWRYMRSIVRSLSANQEINVWFPEVHTGEEVFSFLILVHELGIMDKVNVVCQHVSGERLSEIEKGILNNRNIQLNSSNYVRIEGSGVFDDYYSIEDNVFVLKNSLMKNVRTLRGHFLDTGAPKDTAIIMFRNNMLYYDKEVSERSIAGFWDALLPGGIIAIGYKERIPESFDAKLECLNSKEKIFKKLGFEIIWSND